MTDGNLGAYAEAVALKLLGEPNREKSTKYQLRFGTHGSMAVEIGGNKAGTWYDFEDEVGGGVVELVERVTGLANGEAFNWLRQMGIEVGPAQQTDQRIVATYDYTDEAGKSLFQVVRYAPKRFVQRRRAEDGRWVWGLKAGTYWLGQTGWKADRGDIPPGAEVRHFPEALPGFRGGGGLINQPRRQRGRRAALCPAGGCCGRTERSPGRRAASPARCRGAGAARRMLS
jgi:hypothetical protein